MQLDKQTMRGAALACGAIGVIAWITLDSWKIAASEQIVEQGHEAIADEFSLEDPKLCNENPNRCFHDSQRDDQGT